ncbi:angiotensinogen [Syngnathus typhle]|uniref:angiotensinogen n=1 Tax=Syngnathus typhle TaxID=161592 RepID=UPI002A6B635B|nr:angiotensinogen [Syngnathus typhle]XP_061141477.1 angiotensinogen [Syngnathus typhle]
MEPLPSPLWPFRPPFQDALTSSRQQSDGPSSCSFIRRRPATRVKMQSLRPTLLVLLLWCCLLGGRANRVYIHPFNLFAADNVSCETLQTQPTESLHTLPVEPLDMEVLTPDARDPSEQDAQKQNVTQRTVVLAELLNSLGLRMYQALSRKQPGTNTLLSPVNTYGSLATFYLGASKKTASSYQLLLGLSSGTDRDDCVSLVDGHKVLKTLHSINSLVDDGPKDEIRTQMWLFTHPHVHLSADVVQGTRDFSDSSFIRGVDFSQPELLNTFVDKTSDGKVKDAFRDVDVNSNLLFFSFFNFQGNWKTAFQPDKTALQEFYVNESTTVMTPMMTRTALYSYFNDMDRNCTVVKLSLSKRSYMLLVLPQEGASLHDIEAKLLTEVMSSWSHSLQEGLLELSLPKFSLSSANDLHELLHNIKVEAELLGSQAQFSQLANTKQFTIDKAVNKVSLEMLEEDTVSQDKAEEAGVAVKVALNRPFFFSVVERESNAILMLGKIINPTL